MDLPTELQAIVDQLASAETDARAIVDGLPEELGIWSPNPESWCISECIDHLAITNRHYLAAMGPAAELARQKGNFRRQPARPGLLGGWFGRLLEPPVKMRAKAPQAIKPRPTPRLVDAFTGFISEQNHVLRFLTSNADLDLASVKFPNPFIPGVRFSLATGLQVIVSHERRHLWQARNVRMQAESARR